ncbi:hypothetical protein NDI52_29775, partial [Leptolyngbya sp. PL-A3]|uniref:hypothetical protein n=1 Tax=Leptolyngbya sp. PL-A3 TaxID=2933911 RepID=UPI003296F22E
SLLLMTSKPLEQILWLGTPSDLWLLALEDSEQLANALEQQEKIITLLEKASELRKRAEKHLPYDSEEPWVSRWVAKPISYMFPSESREVWVGDLNKRNYEMLCQGYPLWMVNIVNVARVLELLISAFKIKISDLIPCGPK